MEKISLCYAGLGGGGLPVVRICVLKYFVCAVRLFSPRRRFFSLSNYFLSFLAVCNALFALAGMLCNRIMRLQRNNGNKIAGVFHLENI
jgi:hypothetical protein